MVFTLRPSTSPPQFAPGRPGSQLPVEVCVLYVGDRTPTSAGPADQFLGANNDFSGTCGDVCGRRRGHPLTPPDLTHIDTWLFDLDHTLYPPTAPVLRLVEDRIRDYMTDLTGLPSDEAWALQKRYLDEYGGAVAGLVKHHDVDPHAFLAFVHDVSLESLSPEPALQAALARLPGRRLVFTNGSQAHAERVLEALALTALIDDVFHTEAAGMIMKPDPRAFAALIAAHAVTPTTTCFFEDRVDNLRPAAALGMTTVLVGENAQASTARFVDHRTAALAGFLTSARVRDAYP